MRIEQFQYLVNIKQTGSITKTAEKFFVSRQVVSHAIRAMENELNLPLLIRENDGLDFTPSGELAVEKATKIVDAYQDFLNAVSAFHSKEMSTQNRQSITIMTIPRFISSIVPTVVSQYQKTNPNIDFNIVPKTSDEILSNFPDDGNTIGLISYVDNSNGIFEEFQLANHPELTLTPFIEGQFYICLTKHSKYNTKPVFDDEDLKKLPLLSYSPGFCQLLPNKENFSLSYIGEINDFQSLCTLIKQDVGVALITLQEYNNLMNGKNFILKPIKAKKRLSIYFAFVTNNSCKSNVDLQNIAELFKNIL